MNVVPNSRPAIGVYMPFFSLNRGGPDVTAMWLIQCLCSIYRVTLVTTRQFNLSEFNRFAGTTLTDEDFSIRILPTIPTPSGLPMSALQGPLFQRFARRCAREFDVCISAMNLLDFGVRGIQFLADLNWLETPRNSLSEAASPDHSRGRSLRGIYRRLGSLLCDRSGRDQLHDDLLVSNSDWVARVLVGEGVNSPVIYPPVPVRKNLSNWEERRPDFVWIGRIAPSKRLESAIDIVSRIRAAGGNCKLHIVGNAIDKEYEASIRNRVQAAGDWVVLDGPKYGEEKTEYLARFQYALHTRADEPFGISVAELVKSGCIVFGPDAAGSAEILNHKDLLFKSEDEAVEKIAKLIGDPKKASQMRRHLSARAARFSLDRFQSSVFRLIENYLKEARSPIHHSLAASPLVQLSPQRIENPLPGFISK